MVKNSGHYLKEKFSTGFALFLFYMKGPISGPTVQVAAELLVPPGLFVIALSMFMTLLIYDLWIANILQVCSVEHVTAIMAANADGAVMPPGIIYAKSLPWYPQSF